MNKSLLTGLAALGLAVGTAGADGPLHPQSCPGPGCEAPKPKLRVIYVEREITAYRTEVRERPITLTVPVIDTRIVGPTQCEIQMPIFGEEKRVRTVLVPKPRRVTREVEECHWVSECVTDPKTGCTSTCSKPIFAVRTDVVTVWEMQPVQEEYLKDVVTMTTVPDTFIDQRVIVDVKMDKQKAVQHYFVQVAYKKKIKVPVFVPYECATPQAPVEKLPEPKPKEGEKPGK